MTSESTRTSELAKALFVEERAKGDVDVETLIRSHPELEEDFRRLDKGYRRAQGVLGRLMEEASEQDQERHQRLVERLTELESPRDPASYLERRKIARGGMSRILEVWDKRLRRTVAMKVLPLKEHGVPGSTTERRRLTRFLEEAQVTGQLGHPSILSVHELGIDAGGHPFFTMPLVQGNTFGDVIKLVYKGEEGWTQARALSVLVRVCEAVAFAHSKGVVHRDIKPANILVGRFGETYVADWGLAKVLGAESLERSGEGSKAGEGASIASLRNESDDVDSALFTLDGDVVGTPSYMAPEQAEGRLDDIGPRTDVYAAGTVLYQLLAGRRPYDLGGDGPGDSSTASEVLARVKQGPPTPVHHVRSEAPAELVAICDKAMAREPAERYGDMLDMARDIEAYLEGRVVSAHATGAFAELRKWMGRNRALATAIGAGVIVAFVGLVSVLVLQADKQRVLTDGKQELEQANEALRRGTYYDAITIAHHQIESGKSMDVGGILAAVPSEERGWEWRLLKRMSDGSTGRLLREITLHDNSSSYLWQMLSRSGFLSGTHNGIELRDETGRVTWSFEGALRGPRWIAQGPEGRRLVVRYMDGQTLLHDLDTGANASLTLPNDHRGVFLLPGEDQLVLTHTGGVSFLQLETGELEQAIDIQLARGGSNASISPTGDSFALSAGSSVLLITLPDLEQRHTWSVAGIPTPLTPRFSRDGGLVTFSSQKSAVCAVFDTETGDRVALLGETPEEIKVGGWYGKEAAIAPDGSWVVMPRFGMVDVWDVASGRKRVTLHGHSKEVVSVLACSNRTVVSSTKNEVLIWDLSEAQVPRRLSAHSEAIYDLAFNPDASLLASVGNDGALVVWDCTARTRRYRLSAHRVRSTNVAFSADGETILTSGYDGYMRTWNASDGELLSESQLGDQGFCDLLTSRSRDFVAAVTYSKSSDGRLYGIRAGKTIFSVRTGRFPQSVVVDPKAELIALTSKDGALELRDTASGDEVRQLRGNSVCVRCAFSPEGERIVTGDDDGFVRLWSTADMSLIRELGRHTNGVTGLTFTHDGARVVTCSLDGTVRVWSPDDGRNVLTLSESVSPFAAVEIAHDDSVLAVSTQDGQILLWEIADP